jgi:hypothetical protein
LFWISKVTTLTVVGDAEALVELDVVEEDFDDVEEVVILADELVEELVELVELLVLDIVEFV